MNISTGENCCKNEDAHSSVFFLLLLAALN